MPCYFPHWQPAAMIDAIRSDGGLTIEWSTGVRPTCGYAVAPSEATELDVPLAALTAALIEAYVIKFGSLLTQPGMCLGARVKEGCVYLDVAIIVADRAVAAALAQDARQFAIRCLHEAVSLPMDDLSIREADSIRDARDGVLYEALRQQVDTALKECGVV
jgi:hypothetical protein